MPNTDTPPSQYNAPIFRGFPVSPLPASPQQTPAPLIQAVNDQIKLSPMLLLHGIISNKITQYQHNFIQNGSSKIQDGHV